MLVGTFRGMEAKGRFLEDSLFEGMPGPPLLAAFAAGGFRANATLNESFRYFKELLQFMAKSPKDVFEGHQALMAQQEKAGRFTLRDIFYNPVGRIINSISPPHYFEYAFRVDDVIGYSRLLDLQRRVIEAGVAPDKIAPFVATAGPGLMNPYTEQPMQWVAATKRISFLGLGNRKAEFGYVKIEHYR
jgi:hypothetical protein